MRAGLKDAFRKHDSDNTGYLSVDQLVGILTEAKIPHNRADLHKFYKQFDGDRDGRITWAEFIAAFSAGPRPAPAPQPKKTRASDGKFIDMTFPPNGDSAFKTSDPAGDHLNDFLQATQGGKISWVRASELCPGGKLFNNIHPNDIAQGVLGDCWLLAGLAALAEFEGAIYNLFETTSASPDGEYHFRIYDMVARQWQSLVIDDFIPVDAQRKPVLAQPQDNEMWVMLAEKAVAKWFGSYVRINGAFSMTPFFFLTDAGPSKCFHQTDASGRTYDVQQASLADPHNRMSVQLAPVGRATADQVWAEIVSADKQNFVMSAWTIKDPPQAAGFGACGEAIAADGIVKGHAYSLVAACQLNADGRTWQVVRLRNPWGANPNAEWKGVLGDCWRLAEISTIAQGSTHGPSQTGWHVLDDLERLPFPFLRLWICTQINAFTETW